MLTAALALGFAPCNLNTWLSAPSLRPGTGDRASTVLILISDPDSDALIEL